MKQIELVKRSDGAFICAYNSDHELSKKVKAGDSVVAKLTVPRSVGFHRKFFALVRYTFNHMTEDMYDKFPSEESLRLELTLQAGYWSKHVTIGGKEIVYPQSIRFDKMDQVTFEQLYSTIIDVILKYFHLEVDQNELVSFM